MIGIYKINNPNGKIYIGQSIDIERRRNQYLLLCCKDQPALYNSLLKYGFKNHTFEIIEKCPIKLLNERERYWQEYYNCVENGLNCKYVKTKDISGKLSKKTKEKISISAIGNKRWLGKKHREESKIKISLSNKGKRKGIIISDKQKKEHSIAMTGGGNSRAVLVLNIENGIYYDCIKDASIAYEIPTTTLRNKLSGYRKNNTSLIYA